VKERRPHSPRTPARPQSGVRGGVDTRLAALAALAAALLAVAVLVATLFASPVAVAAAVSALIVAAGCAWIALSRSGPARMLALVAVAAALTAAAAALYLGGAGRGILAFVVALGLFTVASRSVRSRTLLARRASEPRSPRHGTGSSDRAVLLMNPRSGGGKVERFHLADEARLRGIEPIELQPGDDLRRLATDAVGAARAIGMAGGDGSQALVAAVAMAHSVPYVCVPAGTRNHLALDLGLDREDVVAALDGFTDGVQRQIDVGLVNGSLFVNNVSLGAYAEIVRSDDYRDAKLATMERMLPDLLRPGARPLDLRFADGEGRLHKTAQLVMVSNNPYRLDRLAGVGSRPRLDTGVLGILAVEIASATEAAGLFALEAVGRARDFGGWLEWSAATFTVDSEAKVAAGIDGEAVLLDSPLHFEIVPHGLTVLLPPSAVGISPAGLTPGLSRSTVKELWSEVRTGRDAAAP
jgi:diacylglycerol kinase family enzyme